MERRLGEEGEIDLLWLWLVDPVWLLGFGVALLWLPTTSYLGLDGHARRRENYAHDDLLLLCNTKRERGLSDLLRRCWPLWTLRW